MKGKESNLTEKLLSIKGRLLQLHHSSIKRKNKRTYRKYMKVIELYNIIVAENRNFFITEQTK